METQAQRDGEVKWIPTSVARMQLRVSRQRVYQLLKAGLLVGIQMNGTVLISQRSVDARIALLEAEGGEAYAGR